MNAKSIRRRGRRTVDPVHAAGKRHRRLAVDDESPAPPDVRRREHQPWIPTSLFVGRKRRSARRG